MHHSILTIARQLTQHHLKNSPLAVKYPPTTRLWNSLSTHVHHIGLSSDTFYRKLNYLFEAPALSAVAFRCCVHIFLLTYSFYVF